MTNKIKYPTHPGYWAQRQLLCEVVVIKTLTLLAFALSKSEMSELQNILDVYDSGQKELLEQYENKTIK